MRSIVQSARRWGKTVVPDAGGVTRKLNLDFSGVWLDLLQPEPGL